MKIRSVFVSSVMQDYADRRGAARQTLQELGIAAALAENFRWLLDPILLPALSEVCTAAGR